MYSFEPSEEQQMLIDAVQRFAEKDLRPAARESEETGQLDRSLIEKGWELGILQASVPEAYEGFGERSALTGALAAEVMAWGDLAGAFAVMAPSTYAIPVLAAGTEDQKKEWLPPVIEGEWTPYAAAFIEPTIDFYPAEMSTTAEKSKGSYRLNGVKAFVPFAEEAESLLVFASIENRTQAFVVPKGTSGVEIGEREKLLGLGALPCYRVLLDDVQVPPESRLGGEGGFDPAPVIAGMQVAAAAMAVGVGKAALDYALPYAKEREVWGVPIAQKQSIAFMLAEMAIEVESIRLLVWEAAWKLDAGADASREAFLALSGASEMAMMVTDRAVQVLGGHGYIREHPVELWMRNGRGFPAFTGLAMV
jgi:acyl-CoA dehydrogenase